ncbi:HAD family hydrolase [Candidatus Bathyarchaeota archaeon]|jgi:HAD superfamily hydrolase (TIGR01549 family)|nr:HAD family hydrolase [Candidatus Bathyarchaeota archaeon]MBT4320439.1 HAD family hydrolase [Candidatus Bathyarchaeota archaeon]MBT4425237.1 HAD family hydrolase [Candidatus Bathyarchaeota archaeon]MBT5641522.1 HAD family hydrolase [Candidatus Bathyarchaeota archaeon]MBT6604889.1 HAD family hydrolase [Candidatus Bathyarchaeota archaeon]
MIKAVIFDYGGTLAKSKAPENIVSEKSVERLLMEGIEVEAIDFHNAFFETAEWRMSLHDEGKEIDSYKFYNHLVGIFGHEISKDVSDELEMYLVENGEPDWLVNVEALLIKLSGDYKIALLSNAWLEAPRQILRDKGWGRWFDVMVCSFDIGIPKPDARIFQHTLNLLEVDASEAVMVGDSIKTDIKGAISVGMEAIWVDKEGTSEWKGHTVKTIDELPELLKNI